MSNKSILIIAGEASSDIHGANLIREIKSLIPNIHFFGIGGDRMKEEGVELFYHINQMSLIGLTEVIKHIPFVFKVIDRMVSIAKQRSPDLIILIDYPGLNIRIGKRLKKLKKRIFYYISPQVWAWGKNRIKEIAKFTDKMVVILPFEKEIYQNVGIDVEFVGNPLLDIVKTDLTKEEFFTINQLSRNKITIGLLPGSRIQEIKNLLPEMLKALKIITGKMENVQGIISVSPSIKKSIYEGIIEKYFPIKAVEKFNYPIMKYSDLLVVASGTATLEATIFETPMIIVYKVSTITFLLARLFVKIPYIGLANILAKEMIVPEIIQKKSLGEEIAKEIEKTLKNPEIMIKMRENLRKIKTMLGSSGASKRTAVLALKLIN